MGTLSIPRNIGSEAFLISQAQEGSHEAFNQLTERHYQRVYRVALRIVRNPHDAEDVAQDVFIIMLRKLSDFRGQSALSTWLTSVTQNAAVNHLRRKKRRALSLEEVNAENPNEVQEALARVNGEVDPELDCAANQTKSIIWETLGRLDENYREPMRLRVMEDLSIEEISQRLKMPVGTVKVQLFRGRKTMRKHLESRLRPAA